MKILKYFFINILIILLIFCCFELCLIFYYKKKAPKDTYHIGKIPYSNLLKPEKFRKPVGVNFLKRPIIILGGSFAFGENLSDEQTFGYKLSNYTKRPVYNYAIPGKGLQNALFILQNKVYDKSINNPEYIIYVMIEDHIRRMYTNVCMGDFVGYPDYKIDKNGKIKLYRDYYPIYRQFYTFYYFNNLIYKNILKNDFKRHNLYVTAYFKEMNKEIKKQYPNTKFVILLYGTNNYFGLNFDKLINDGFIVIQTDEITGDILSQNKYQISPADIHPNDKAWDIIIPPLVKKLNL